MTHVTKKPKIPRGCVRCLCGALIVKGQSLYDHIHTCDAVLKVAAEKKIEPSEMFTIHGLKVIV